MDRLAAIDALESERTQWSSTWADKAFQRSIEIIAALPTPTDEQAIRADERGRVIELLKARVKDSEKMALLNEFDDQEWESGWLKRRRGVEDAINLIQSAAPKEEE
jgi:hypothetical protein